MVLSRRGSGFTAVRDVVAKEGNLWMSQNTSGRVMLKLYLAKASGNLAIPCVDATHAKKCWHHSR